LDLIDDKSSVCVGTKNRIMTPHQWCKFKFLVGINQHNQHSWGMISNFSVGNQSSVGSHQIGGQVAAIVKAFWGKISLSKNHQLWIYLDPNSQPTG